MGADGEPVSYTHLDVYKRQVWNGLLAVTEPVLRPIRNFLPAMGGMDLSPIVLILGIIFLENVIKMYIWPNVF